MKRQWLFILGFVGAMGLALSLRVGDLSARPMHADEGNNTIIFKELYETGSYVYSPLDHHGPSLYYVTLPFVWMSGAADFNSTDEATYRAVSVACGLLLIAMLWLVRDAMGGPALIMAAALLAVSPAFVFYNRYYIHEPLFLVFNFGLLAAGWRYIVRPHIGWAVMAGACVGLSFATKETCVILWAAMALGVAVVWLIERRRALKAAIPAAAVGASIHAGDSAPITTTHDGPPARAAASRLLPPIDSRHLAAAIVAAIVPVVLLFSAFFRHPRGIVDSVLSYFNYAQRAQGAGHEAPWYAYLKLLAYFHRDEVLRAPVWSEGLILGLALLGAVVAATGLWLGPTHRRFARFILIYTLFTTAVFAAIPYKTPWNVMPFLHGIILLAGIGVAAVMARSAPVLRIALAIGLAFGLVHLRNQAELANSERYFASRANPYVYAHTTTDTVRHLVPFVERLAAAAPGDRPFILQIYCDNAWPLPWYLRRFDHVGYGTRQTLHPQAGIVLVELTSHDDLALWQAKLGDAWRNPGSYTLRPNVFLTAFVREELFQAMLN